MSWNINLKDDDTRSGFEGLGTTRPIRLDSVKVRIEFSAPCPCTGVENTSIPREKPQCSQNICIDDVWSRSKCFRKGPHILSIVRDCLHTLSANAMHHDPVKFVYTRQRYEVPYALFAINSLWYRTGKSMKKPAGKAKLVYNVNGTVLSPGESDAKRLII